MKTCSRTVHGKITPASGKFFFPRRHKNGSSGGSSRRSCRQYALDLGVSAQNLSRRLPAIVRGTRAGNPGSATVQIRMTTLMPEIAKSAEGNHRLRLK